MIPLPVIDVTSRTQTLDELAAPLDERRLMARRAGELWAAIIRAEASPFVGTDTATVSVFVVNSTDDAKVAEFAEFSRVRQFPSETKAIEVIGSEIDVAIQAHRLGFSYGPNVVEVTVRLIDRIARAHVVAEQQTDSPRNAPDFDNEEDGA